MTMSPQGSLPSVLTVGILEEPMDDLQKQLTVFKDEILQFVKDDNRYTRDLLMQEIKAAKTELRQEIQSSEKKVLFAVAQILDGHIVPQIDDHEVRLTKLETQLA